MKKENKIVFSLEDNGTGIPLDKIDSLFKKFYQIDTTMTRKHGGTGLGLAISKGIVEAHGGEMWVDKKYTGGAKFIFTLPIKDDKLKVLAIDDNKEITDMLSLYFETQGIEFAAINDGRQGLEAIRNEDSNLILLDLAMPDFSGVDVVDYLKKENLVESKNIVIFTASSVSNELFDDLKKIGVKEILKKPVDMNALEELIARFRTP